MLASMIDKIRIWSNSRKIAAHYRRWPYKLNKIGEFNNSNHEHTCFVAHLPNVDLSEICPYAVQTHNSSKISDECELCKYFGMILYERNPKTGEKQIRFVGDKEFLTNFEE